MEIWFAFRCAGGAGGIDSLPSPAQHHHRSDGFARLRVVLRGSEFPDPHGKNAGATGSDCFRIPAAGFLYSDPRRQSTYFRTHQQFGILLDFISDSRIISRAECDRHGPTAWARCRRSDFWPLLYDKKIPAMDPDYPVFRVSRLSTMRLWSKPGARGRFTILFSRKMSAESGMAQTRLPGITPQRVAPSNTILVDYTMAGMNGRETLAAIRSTGCKSPAILCSGYISNAKDGAYEDSFDGFLQKPFRHQEREKVLAQVTHLKGPRVHGGLCCETGNVFYDREFFSRLACRTE